MPDSAELLIPVEEMEKERGIYYVQLIGEHCEERRIFLQDVGSNEGRF